MIIKKIKDNIIIDKTRKYFDFTASGLAYKPIEKKISKILLTYANTHSDSNNNSITTSNYYNQARKDLYRTLELDDSFCILPTGTGATGAIKKFQELLGLYIPPKTIKRFNIKINKKPLVIIGPFEHHSNEVSYREALCDVIRIPLCKQGYIDLKILKDVLEKNKNREIIGSFSAASNVTGIFNPIKQISFLIKKYNGILAIDTATTSAYKNIDKNLYDALFLAPHKLLGGIGSSGLLVIKKSLIDTEIPPTFGGGGTVDYVSRKTHSFLNSIEQRESAGTPGILQFIKTSMAYNLRNKIGLDFIHKKEEELRKYFISKIIKIDNIILYCKNNKNKLPIFSFNIKNINPYDIAFYLSDNYNIDVRAGCSCAGPYGHDILNLKEKTIINKDNIGWVRVSIHYIHTKKDIDFLIQKIQIAAKNLS